MKNDEMTLAQVLALLQRKVKDFGSIRALAQDMGVAESYLSEVLGGKQTPGKKILDALDLEHVDKYRWKRK